MKSSNRSYSIILTKLGALLELTLTTLALTGCLRTSTLAPPAVALTSAPGEPPVITKRPSGAGERVRGSDCQTSLFTIFPLAPEPALLEALQDAVATTALDNLDQQLGALEITESELFALLFSRKCISVSGNKLTNSSTQQTSGANNPSTVK